MGRAREVTKSLLEPARNLHHVVDLYCNIPLVFLNGATILEHLPDEDLDKEDENDIISDMARQKNWYPSSTSRL